MKSTIFMLLLVVIIQFVYNYSEAPIDYNLFKCNNGKVCRIIRHSTFRECMITVLKHRKQKLYCIRET
jgi:hypothetical protein